MKKNLNNVTLLGIDCLDINRIHRAMTVCTYYCDFYDIKILSSLKHPDNPYIHPIKHILNIDEYSKFMIKELNNHFESDYVLIFQHDGFILNPNAWRDEFFEYDYIGAVWWADEDYFINTPRNIKGMGNGGFSLRSKKLCAILQNENIICDGAEDYIICTKYREQLESLGVKFAPIEVAEQFSVEYKPYNNEFGFHQLRFTNIENWEDKELFGY